MTSPPSASSSILKFSSLASQVEPSFWFTLSTLKLNVWKLDSSPQRTFGIYSTPVRPSPTGDGIVALNNAAFDVSLTPDGCAVAKGWTCNFNTEEDWRNQRLSTAKELEDNYLELIQKRPEDVLQCPALLAPYHVLCYANLKKYVFDYHSSFPVLPSKWNVTGTRAADPDLVKAAEEYIANASPEQRGFFIVRKSRSAWCIEPLSSLRDNRNITLGYLNSSSTPGTEGQPLQNLLTFLSLHNLLPTPLEVFSLSRHAPTILTLSPQDHPAAQVVLKLHARWEKDYYGKRVPRRHNLSTLMDPRKRIAEARDLNNNLMRWRVAKGLDLEVVKNSKVLVLGMGTLGCGVVRTLMGWGCNEFKIVDNGVVSFSNPSRQSFYTFDDCVSGSTLKVDASAAAMRRVDPGVLVDAINITIPMPDHPSSFKANDYETLIEVISWCDVVFLLMDTREARWLPTLVCTAKNKLVINAAIGFDSYVVMRHGLPSQRPRLGCYFCSDIVSPANSTDSATLDQQCTVTRPGVAPITASLATELYVTTTQHPLGQNASAAPNEDSDFGLCAHQIRGQMAGWEQTCLTGLSSPYCVGCGDSVVNAWKERADEFVRAVCERGGGKELERVSGLEDIKKGFEGGWDGDGEGEDDDWEL